MEFVEITHPDIKGAALVPASSLDQHRLAGWSLTTEAAPPAKTRKHKES